MLGRMWGWGDFHTIHNTYLPGKSPGLKYNPQYFHVGCCTVGGVGWAVVCLGHQDLRKSTWFLLCHLAVWKDHRYLNLPLRVSMQITLLLPLGWEERSWCTRQLQLIKRVVLFNIGLQLSPSSAFLQPGSAVLGCALSWNSPLLSWVLGHFPKLPTWFCSCRVSYPTTSLMFLYLVLTMNKTTAKYTCIHTLAHNHACTHARTHNHITDKTSYWEVGMWVIQDLV